MPMRSMPNSPRFQFHKGTIKTFDTALEARIDTNFNSIKVRLKPEINLPNRGKSRFQFHKGTIKTEIARKISGEDTSISIP